jgi:CDP-6-deoxy-D-xylo-4-hexulose-3-dehydrase
MTDQPMTNRRIEYASSVHDQREIDAVVEVLRGRPTALRIGKNVRAMEQRVAALLGKRRGVMCNPGSSALYLAIEVLVLEPGDEIVTSAVAFSTDIAPMIRADIVPAFVDVTSASLQIDVAGIEAMIGPRTRAILAPNLIGNAPDWEAIVTAAGTGGMVCFDDDDHVDRALLLHRWGRWSEVQLFGSTKGTDQRFFSAIDGDVGYDNLFIFDQLGWNFELTTAGVERWPDLFTIGELTPGVRTGWHMFPVIINPASGIRRGDFQQWMERHGVDTRMVGTGNATRQPAFRDQRFRTPDGGFPNADRVMEWGSVLPNSHSLTDGDCDYIGVCVDGFVRVGGWGDERTV